MILHKKDTLEHCARKTDYGTFAIGLIVCIGLLAGVLQGGSRTQTAFPLINDGNTDSNLVATTTGVGLAIERYALVKVFGDSLPASSTVTFYSDVVGSGKDTFTYYYVDTVLGGVYKRNAILGLSAAELGSAQKVCTINPPKDCYLHVDNGDHGVLCSFIQRGTLFKRYLQINNGNHWANIDSAESYGWLFSGQCHLAADTFLVINTVDMNRVILRKVYSNGASLLVTDTVTVASGSATQGNSLMNCSVAADGNGTILATAIRGSPNNNKFCYYQFYTSNFTPIAGGMFANKVSDNKFYYYEDVPVASYGAGKFALVSWDSAGVVLHQLELSGLAINEKTTRILTDTGIIASSIAANDNYLVAIARGDFDGNDTVGIEGIRYENQGGSLVNPEVISFSDPAVTVDTADIFSTAINSAFDDSGNIALTWRHKTKVQGAVWARKGIRYKKGFYTSPVESLTVAENDSLQFYPVRRTLTDQTYWNTQDSIRIGCSAAACSAAPWLSFSDSLLLRNQRSTCTFYQYRITLLRRADIVADSITTPTLTAVTVPWNFQPTITGIDSVRVGDAVIKPVTMRDTLPIIVRKDSVTVYFAIADNDSPETLVAALSMAAVPPVKSYVNKPTVHDGFTIIPLSTADTVVTCSVLVRDANGWAAKSKQVFVKTRNSIPRIDLRLAYLPFSGVADTGAVTNDTTLLLQYEDTIVFYSMISDSNDSEQVRGTIQCDGSPSLVVLDSIFPGVQNRCVLRADTVTPVDTLRVALSVFDQDTLKKITVSIIVNHPPHITTVRIGEDTLRASASRNVVVNESIALKLDVDDTDCSFFDTLTYYYRIGTVFDSIKTNATAVTLSMVPQAGDSTISLRVADLSGRSDTFSFSLHYPWLALDTINNPQYVSGVRALAAGVALIDGSQVNDTIKLPLVNIGRDSMTVTALIFSQKSEGWLTVFIGDDTATLTAASSELPNPVVVAPDSTVFITVVFSAKQQVGDKVVHDTLIIVTDDPQHPSNTIPVTFEYNDLPQLVSVVPDFDITKPYKSLRKQMAYWFPPHAAVTITFSEPMDSLSALEGISCYSALDAAKTGIRRDIPLNMQWLQGYTKVALSPNYDTISAAFGLRPPTGLFIPTDSLEFSISTDLHDRANTPHGPNALDIHRWYKRSIPADTTLPFKVDSISFTVASISPEPGTSAVPRQLQVTLEFSSPVYAASVDTARIHNRSLVIRSHYNGGEQLSFQSVISKQNQVVFTVAQKLFYKDRLTCSYSSRWIRDAVGFASDNNADGIDATLFDSLATTDNLQWIYQVKPVVVSSVSPDSTVVLSDITTPVVIHFSDTLSRSVFDTDTSRHNRSIRVGANRTGWSSFNRIVFSADSSTITLYPRTNFFSGDSIYAVFTGFNADYRYSSSSNLPDSTGQLFGSYHWHFRSGNVGFYTYPNPYKPGSDPRHCGSGGPCGIWFKNLHTLGVDVYAVAIVVYNVNAHPVFDTRTVHQRINFARDDSEHQPQWLWDTRSNKGTLVASGLYLYAIYNLDGALLKKGKLVIVR